MCAEATKVCNGPLCKGKEKPASEFNKRGDSKDGLQHWCITCKREWRKSPFVRERAKTQRRHSYTRQKRDDYASYLFKNAQTNAKRRGIEFALTKEWFRERVSAGVCELTGIRFVFGEHRHPFLPSTDRIDSGDIYRDGNCRMVLWMINLSKNDMSEELFRSAFLQIAGAMLESK